MRFVRALHKWIGLIAGLQLCLWLISGLMMSLLDHHAVSGDSTIAERTPAPVRGDERIVEPAVIARGHAGQAIREIKLDRQLGGWVWRVRTDERIALYDARDGAPIAIDAERALAIAADERAGDAQPARAARITAPTLETRGHDGPLWRVDFNDAQQTRYYIAADDGSVVARRTGDWRVFDFFWMLHTMDYRGRDDFSNPLAVTFAVLSIWMGLSGVLLLWRSFGPTFRRRSSRS